MSIKKIKEVNASFGLGLGDDILTKVAERFALLKQEHQDDQDWAEAIKSAVPNVNNNPLEAEAKKQALAINQICSICNSPGREVTLLGGRKAYYCPTHKVVTPVAKL
jgi:hypothetical protein